MASSATMSADAWWEERKFIGSNFPPPPPHRMQSLRGPAFSNWIISDHVLQGPHPASGASGADSMVRVLRDLLEAGVTTFVCLQDEMPVTGGASAGAGADAGTRYGAPSALVRSAYGTGNVVTAKPYMSQATMVAQTAGMPQSAAGHGLSFIHVPIRDTDGSICSDAVLKRLVTDMAAYIKAGELIYLQCADGNGRSGTIAATLVGAVYGMSSSEALDAVQRSRDYRTGSAGHSPETHEQKMQVHRVLGDQTFRAQVAAVPPRLSLAEAEEAATSKEAASVLAHIRTLLQRRGMAAVCSFRSFLHSRCNAGPGRITIDAVADALADAGLYLTAAETSAVLSWLDTAGAGAVDPDRLADAVRGSLPPHRRSLVQAVFNKMDPARAGRVSMDDIAICFNAEGHPDVKSGRRAAEDVLHEFKSTFGVASRGRHVSPAEFESYWADVSAACPEDSVFKMVMWGVWGLDGSELSASSRGAGIGSTQHRDGVGIVPVSPGKAGASGAADSRTAEDAAAALRRSLLKHGGEFGVAKACAALRDLANEAQRAHGDDGVDLPALRASLRGGGALMDTQDELDAETVFAACSTGVSGAGHRESAPVRDIERLLCRALTESRQRLVASAFHALDTRWRGQGSVPAGELAGMFRSERHPSVTAGKRSADAVLRDFLDVLGRGDPTDGCVRQPLFERICAGLAAAYDDDAGFSLMLWQCFDLATSKTSGATVHRPATAVETRFSQGIAARAALTEAGLLDRVDALASGVKPNSTGPRIGHRQHFESHPAKHTTAQVVGSQLGDQSVLTSPYASRGGYGLGVASAGASREIATGSRVVVEGRAAETRKAAAATVLDSVDAKDSPIRREDPAFTLARGGDRGKRHNVAAEAALRADQTARLISQAPDEVDRLRAAYSSPSTSTKPAAPPQSESTPAASAGVLRARELLRSRGVRGVCALLQWLGIGITDDASLTADPARRAVPHKAFASRLREHGLGLSEADAMDVAVACSSLTEPGMTELRRVFEQLCPTLSQQRLRLSSHTFDALVSSTSSPAAAVAATGRMPTGVPLGEVRLAYNAARHPEVLAVRRSEADALREFLETFYPSADDKANVTRQAFLDYYQAASAGLPEDDMHFSSLMWAVWDLQSAPVAGTDLANPAGTSAVPAAGRDSAPPRADHLSGAAAIPSPMQGNAPSRRAAGGLTRTRIDAAGMPAAGGPASGATGWGVERLGWTPATDVVSGKHGATVGTMPGVPLPHTGQGVKSASGVKGWGVETLGWTPARNVAAGAATDGSGPGSPAQSVGTVSAGGPVAVCERLRRTLARRGPRAYLDLALRLRQAGGFPAGPLPHLTAVELQKALSTASVGLSPSELGVVIDGIGDGARVSAEQLLRDIVGSMSRSRQELVDKAWRAVAGRSDTITAADAAMGFHAEHTSQVRAGRTSEAQAMKDFVAPLLELGGAGATPEGVVLSAADWHRHFSMVSAGIPDDGAFRLMIWEAFGLGR